MLSHHSLKPNLGSRKAKRFRGRGDGSGRGSYSSRGGKGQTARSGGNIKPGFEGGQTPLIRRFPKFRGFKNPNRVGFQAVNVEKLNVFDDGATVTIVELYEQKAVSRKNGPVKILGDGELTKKLTLKVDAVSAGAKKKIEAAGGKVILPAPRAKTELIANKELRAHGASAQASEIGSRGSQSNEAELIANKQQPEG